MKKSPLSRADLQHNQEMSSSSVPMEIEEIPCGPFSNSLSKDFDLLLHLQSLMLLAFKFIFGYHPENN